MHSVFLATGTSPVRNCRTMNFTFLHTPYSYIHRIFCDLPRHQFLPPHDVRRYRAQSAFGRSVARRTSCFSCAFSNLSYQYSPVSLTGRSRAPPKRLPFFIHSPRSLFPVVAVLSKITQPQPIRSHLVHSIPHVGTDAGVDPSDSSDTRRVSESHVSNADVSESTVSKEQIPVSRSKKAWNPPLQKAPKCPLVADFGPLDVLCEDDVILVLNKQAGIKHEPLHRFVGGSLVNRVAGYLGKEPFTMHRLDMYTSGVLLFAKERHVIPHLTAQFLSGQIEKKYLVMVLGLPEKQFVVNAPIGRDPNHKFARTVLWDGGQHALTYFRVLSSNATSRVSLLEAILDTGRTHQIRVHLQHVGLPVLGDEIYGALPILWDGVYGPILSPTPCQLPCDNIVVDGKDCGPLLSSIQQHDVGSNECDRLGNVSDVACSDLGGRGKSLELRVNEGAIQRQALHAYSLNLTHPITNERMEFVASIPEDMCDAMSACGIEYPI